MQNYVLRHCLKRLPNSIILPSSIKCKHLENISNKIWPNTFMHFARYSINHWTYHLKIPWYMLPYILHVLLVRDSTQDSRSLLQRFFFLSFAISPFAGQLCNNCIRFTLPIQLLTTIKMKLVWIWGKKKR